MQQILLESRGEAVAYLDTDDGPCLNKLYPEPRMQHQVRSHRCT